MFRCCSKKIAVPHAVSTAIFPTQHLHLSLSRFTFSYSPLFFTRRTHKNHSFCYSAQFLQMYTRQKTTASHPAFCFLNTLFVPPRRVSQLPANHPQKPTQTTAKTPIPALLSLPLSIIYPVALLLLFYLIVFFLHTN